MIGGLRDENEAARAEHKRLGDALDAKIKSGEDPTDAELQDYFDSSKRVSNARLQPLKDVGNKFMGSMEKRQEEAEQKQRILNYKAEKDAEKKYGEGNAQYLWNFGGKPVYVKADSFIGKTAKKRQARTEK